MTKLYIALLITALLIINNKGYCKRTTQRAVIELVAKWSREIGETLTDLSKELTREALVKESFNKLQNQMYTIDGTICVEEIATKIRNLMAGKTKSVSKIAEYAEFLSYYRSNETVFRNSSYYYFNADNLTDIEPDPIREQQIEQDIVEAECHWWCLLANQPPLPHSSFNKPDLDKLFRSRNSNDVGTDCECGNLPDRDRDPLSYLDLSMRYDPKFEEPVNMKMSVVKLATNVYDREEAILGGVKWSESLDLVFRDNLARDPTLTWQYFASPRGFMRHFPAVQWSDEQYYKTYDFRTRSWYTEAMTSPKDIIILLDRSGSMTGEKIALSRQIVNNILDTLNDNDFVNIYTFTNTTEPVVSCFNDTLVQANEENLRLLRESLTVYNEEFAANLTLGFYKAFEILKYFRKLGKSSKCIQAIMLITEQIDYYYDPNMFKLWNWDEKTPVRIFTYQIGSEETDGKHMEWMACANMGYFVNITFVPDIREKILNYLNVMSRPINYDLIKRQDPIWSYLHVDLADRRLSNWLWRKFEGLRQREVFLDHVKRDYKRNKKILTSKLHMLLKETHEFEQYGKKHDYNYMTTVSLPVYGRRMDEHELIGVAGVDVPIKLIKKLIPFYKLGVNGYAFIVTNNGYVLMHPDHRREFENILKPTFNRVDLLEVEILDDDSEPRLFAESIVKLREKIVLRQKLDHAVLKVKFPLHDMKRVMLSNRRYYFTETGPFTFGIVLPNNYGAVKINMSHIYEDHTESALKALNATSNWKVHPDWDYCNRNCKGGTPEEKVVLKLRSLMNPYKNVYHSKNYDLPNDLLKSLIYEASVTNWFNNFIRREEELNHIYNVNKVFLATHSGLTRWRSFNNSNYLEEDKDSFEIRNNKAIDEDWYRRAVEENYKDENIFIYSVPFEISGYENNTMITGTKAIFVNGNNKRTPIGVVGLQFNQRAMYALYNEITTKRSKNISNYTCESDYLNCFILDNNAYIVLADEIEFTGRYIGDIRPDIMYHLIKDNIYEATRMFDYQAICQKLPPKKKKKKKKNSASRPLHIFENVIKIGYWLVNSIVLLVQSVLSGPEYQSIKQDTLAFEKLEIKKTLPTPCDHDMWLFNLNKHKKFPFSMFYNKTSKFVCDWPYVIDRIPNSNLLFLAINGYCNIDTENTYKKSPTPQEIVYNETLPCYIATRNNYTRRVYMHCFKKNSRETNLNKNRFYCGHTWK